LLYTYGDRRKKPSPLRAGCLLPLVLLLWGWWCYDIVVVLGVVVASSGVVVVRGRADGGVPVKATTGIVPVRAARGHYYTALHIVPG